MKDDRVLIDTSVWIAYFRKQDDPVTKKVDQILTGSEVCVPKVVIAELLQGAKSEKEILVIEEFVEAFQIIDQTEDTWLKAGRLSFTLKRKGFTANLIDCYIAVLASEKGCQIFSLDEHFKFIKKFMKITLMV